METKKADTKYAALENFLRQQKTDKVMISFEEIEQIIGTKLPSSAYRHRPWWSNNPFNSSITSAWLNAGYRSEQVDMRAHRLVFRRVGSSQQEPVPPLTSRQKGPGEAPVEYAIDLRHPLFGILKGTIRVTPGTDLTQPADTEWGGE